jgi:hypothetical protein
LRRRPSRRPGGIQPSFVSRSPWWPMTVISAKGRKPRKPIAPSRYKIGDRALVAAVPPGLATVEVHRRSRKGRQLLCEVYPLAAADFGPGGQ